MKFAIKLTVMTAIILMPFSAVSDSPVTSTHFHTAYANVEMVKKAKAAGIIDTEIAKYLSSPAYGIDYKAAVVNAIGWSIEGKSNAVLYRNQLEKIYARKDKKFNEDILTPDEIFCLGYLTLLDDYFHPEKAIPLLKKAKKLNPKSFTVAIILALAQAQESMNSDWCDVWKITDKVFTDPELVRDMRTEAIEIIFNYMALYRDECD